MMKLEDAAGRVKARTGLMAVLSCLSYSFCSVSMVMSNKALAYVFEVKFQFLLVVMQCIVATLLVECGRRLGYAKYDPFSMSTARRWLPVSICFSCMLFTSFKALALMNVPMVTVFKNLTNIVIVTGDWWIFHQSVSFLVIFSMAVMVFGALVASYNDFKFDPWGYFWMVANCCATAGYVLYMKYATQTIKLPRFGMVFYNNLLTTIMMAPLAYWAGEFQVLASSTQLHTPIYITVNLFSGVVGVLLNFASLWCVASTSATTYAVVGSVNVVPTAIIGYGLFKGNINRPMGYFMALSMLGGFMYSFAKIQEKNKMKMSEKIAAQDVAEKEGLIMKDVEECREDQTADHKA